MVDATRWPLVLETYLEGRREERVSRAQGLSVQLTLAADHRVRHGQDPARGSEEGQIHSEVGQRGCVGRPHYAKRRAHPPDREWCDDDKVCEALCRGEGQVEQHGAREGARITAGANDR